MNTVVVLGTDFRQRYRLPSKYYVVAKCDL
jgi:hypothetical protein